MKIPTFTKLKQQPQPIIAKVSDGFPRLYRGQTVHIIYDESVRQEYPHTYKLFNEKAGTVLGIVQSGGTLVRVWLPLMNCETLVERRHIR